MANLSPSELGDVFREKIGSSRTANENIWDDVMEPGIWMRVWLKDSKKSYLGQIKYIEDYEREPIIVLEYYQFLGEDSEVLIDNSEDCNRTVMLNLSEFERIELIRN